MEERATLSFFRWRKGVIEKESHSGKPVTDSS